MNERKLSELQKEYRAFFLGKMKLYGVKSPAELSREKKSEFFTEIKKDWARHKLLKKQKKDFEKKKSQQIVKEPIEVYSEQSEKETKQQNNKRKDWTEQGIKVQHNRQSQQQSDRKSPHKEQEQPPHKYIKEIIKSLPNQEQTNDLRILFNPNNHFYQETDYLYPVVKMPKENCLLKLPREGRTNQKGFKEDDFYNQIKNQIPYIESTNNVHMVIPNFNRPYEPDIVLYDKNLNLYIDIEIDEPYDGYFRYPTHYIHPEEEVKKDNIRDLFFTESGWIVIRFTEKQVHCQTNECIDHIKNILNSIYNKQFDTEIKCEKENQWDYNLCIQWQKVYYRENYLGIQRFQKQYSYKEINIDITENESIEKVIQRTKKLKIVDWNTSLGFDEKVHVYAKDETGNSEYISVTTLIERFFPFDLKRYIEKKAEDENRTEEDVLDEYLTNRDEAAEKGTSLHNQIENFLIGADYDPSTIEFQQFLNFYKKEIFKRNLTFSDAEKMIFSDKFNVAGTIDCLFKKDYNNEYVMLDWKRSKKLVMEDNGEPNMIGFPVMIIGLTHMNNCSFYRYCLQQNIYKYIVETEYSMKISSMKLVVLHEKYPKYYVVNVPELKRETNIILNSLKVKI